MASQQPRKVIHLPKVRMLSRGGRLASSGLRITNVKSIKPPDPEIIKKQEEEKLRVQLHKEIVSRSRTCAFKGYECILPVLSDRHYCRLHILKDPTAPYRQCGHTYNNGEQCPLPAPIEQNDPRDLGLCFEHARQCMHARQRSAAPPPPVTTTETLLNQLQHYVKPERPRTTSCASSVSVVSDPCEQEQVSPQAVDPFRTRSASVTPQILRSARISTAFTLLSCSLFHTQLSLPYVSVGTSTALCTASWAFWLRRAGVYTVEEAVSEAKNTLRSLQSAYVRQMDRLRVLLQMARLQYLRSLKAEKEQYCSINNQARNNPLSVRERRQLRKLKAYASYHRKHGVDAVLARKLHHKRAKVNDPCQNRPIPSAGRCTFTEGGVRCSTHVLPAAKHCLKHILQDKQQVLFTACGDSRGLSNCKEVVSRLPLPSNKCRYHTDPPHYTVFTLKKDDSGSDSETRISSDVSQEDIADLSVEDRADSGHEGFNQAMEMPYE
ncbi:hypothetical protein K1T71_014124 [Dendrolimus kikuchii]|uniref:Uncharacterized protein n=1 Tax=Dendrolimus kikuchii TaxID=765133 RepID=A0ACC1CFD6_9NEOP|nr:hypothetical protein K1T71_014124 [Dendrolimus kikuchii]